MQRAGRRGAEGAESSYTLIPQEVVWDTGHILSMGDLKAHPHGNIFQQGHTYSNIRPYLLIVPLL